MPGDAVPTDPESGLPAMYVELAAQYRERTKDMPFRPCDRHPDCRCGRRQQQEQPTDEK